MEKNIKNITNSIEETINNNNQFLNSFKTKNKAFLRSK